MAPFRPFCHHDRRAIACLGSVQWYCPGTGYLPDARSQCAWAGTGYASVPTDSEPLGLAAGATGGMRLADGLCLASAGQYNRAD
ncbi:hypothetical protein N7510_006091 [Penicillium lagena]|uniref:uncharacterized protein n=1 Tax=Penicillium lagena TaxID=94218 RepID=UPI002540AD3C|nr:uncharacterized protein N7510_006091 [Penicillium lagena]KAJ5612897.1 hypothetical protein N7510_006091 [Penicillium lagena]